MTPKKPTSNPMQRWSLPHHPHPRIEKQSHNARQPIAKLPTEIWQKILSHLLDMEDASIRATIKPEISGAEAVKRKRIFARLLRSRVPQEVAAEAEHRNFAASFFSASPLSKAVDPHATQAGIGFMRSVTDAVPLQVTQAHNGFRGIDTDKKQIAEPKTKPLDLLLVDSAMFLPNVQAMLYRDPPWSINIMPDGVDFMGLPLIPRMHTLREDFTLAWQAGFEVFDSTLGLVRFGTFRNLTFNIWAPSGDIRNYLLRMTRNVQFLATLIQENQNAEDAVDHLYSLTINLCQPFESRIHDYSPVNTEVNNLHVVRDRNGAPISAWSKPIPSTTTKQVKDYYPAEALFAGTMAIDLVTLPLRRLRRINNVVLNLPPELRGHQRAKAFKAELEAELHGGDVPVDLSRERMLEGFFDHLDEMDYQRKIKEMKRPGYKQEHGMTWYYENTHNMADFSDQMFWMNPDNEADVGARSDDTVAFNAYWEQAILTVSDLMNRERES
jgi:hypothetical protein